MATEDPKFSEEKSENFNNVTHFSAVYKDKPMIIAPEFDWIKYNGLKYDQVKIRTYKNKGKNKILKLDKHPFYYIDKPVLEKQLKKEHNIPKIIWQTMRDLPKEGTSVYDAVQTFKAQEGWEHRFVTDENAKVFLKENFDEDVLHAFEVLVPGAFKADLLRACLLYIHGGVYADSKLFLHYDLDSFLEGDLVLTTEKGKAWGIWNGFMAAIPKQEYFKNVIDNIIDNVSVKFYGDHDLEVTGPILYGKTYKEYFQVHDIVKQSNVTLLKANHVLNDDKDYINSKNNQELFISWDAKRKYKKEYNSLNYSILWRERKVYANDLKYLNYKSPYKKIKGNILNSINYHIKGKKEYFLFNTTEIDDIVVSRISSTNNKNFKEVGLYKTIPKENFTISEYLDKSVENVSCLVKETNNSISFIKKIKTKEGVSGYEDPRLFKYRNSYWIICTKIDKNGQRLIIFDINNSSKEYELKYKNRNKVEKNWLPFVVNDELYFLYSIDPYIVLKYNENECIKVVSTVKKNIFSEKIGGSVPGIDFKYNNRDYFMFGGHISINKYHIIRKNFFFLTEKTFPFDIKFHTEILDFNNHPIEFLSGMYIKNDKVVLSYGVNDCYSEKIEVKKEEISKLMMKI